MLLIFVANNWLNDKEIRYDENNICRKEFENHTRIRLCIKHTCHWWTTRICETVSWWECLITESSILIILSIFSFLIWFSFLLKLKSFPLFSIIQFCIVSYYYFSKINYRYFAITFLSFCYKWRSVFLALYISRLTSITFPITT